VIPRVVSRRNQLTTRARTPSISPGQAAYGRAHGISIGNPKPITTATPFSPSPSSAPAIGSQSPSIPQSDPRDAQYFNDVAKLDQFYSSRRADLTASGQELSRNLVKNRGLLAEQQPKDELGAKQNANKAGLFYSGALGKNLGDIAQSYARRRSDLQSEYESNSGKITRNINDLDTNYGPNGLLRNDALLGGIGRASASDQVNAMGLAAQAGPAPTTAAPASLPFTTQPGISKAGVAGTWHIYPGGRKVFVARR
jgi:hypothetical protein